MTFYFAYGSNMDKKDLEVWCKEKNKDFIDFKNTCVARLKNYQLTFNYKSISRKGGAANIMVSPGNEFYGLLSEVNETDIKTLKTKEGFPNYYQEIVVTLEKLDGTVVEGVKTYKVVSSLETSAHQLPTRAYLFLIVNNAIKYNFPESYIKYLNSIKFK